MISVLIVGAGLSGISQAIQLRRLLGDELDLTIIDREDDIGGTWLNSTWPGAGVDIPIHLYSLYSDPSTRWENFFASQNEVLQYLKDCVGRHRLGSHLRLSTTFIRSEWDSQMQGHVVEVEDEKGMRSHISANVLISANGPLSAPKLPDIPGRGRFTGHSFHNLHWRKQSGDLRHKRIAVIGNGSSAVQFIPGLAALEGVEIKQYIRSGGYYFPKVNYQYSTLQKGAFRWIPGWRYLHRYLLFQAHNERWKARNEEDAAGHAETEKMLIDYLESVAPAEYVEDIRPHYPLGCKRPAYDAGWLESLHRPNVSLNSAGIQEITEDSIIDRRGDEFKADVIIYATGSDVGENGVGLNRDVFGEGGVELRSWWKDIGGPQSYLGLAVPGFPNYFITIGPNAVAGSWGFTIGNQTTVIAGLIRDMVRYNIGELQPRQGAFERHNAHIQRQLRTSTMNSDACVSWWKIGGNGRLSVPNYLDAVGLWWHTRTIQWNDWLARSTVADGSTKPVEVDVGAIVLHRRLVHYALGTLTTGLVLVVGRACYRR